MTTQPQIWTRPLGENADVNKIEDYVADDSGNVSFAKLFGKITAVPLEQGGVAPEREDFNALFKLLGEVCYYFMHGGIYNYEKTVDYNAGSFVRYNNELYVCIATNGPSSTVKDPTNTDYWSNIKTAIKLSTPRTINIQDASGTNTGTGVEFDGSDDVTMKLPENIKADLEGNASSATKAIQDGEGNVITETYATKGDNKDVLNDIKNYIDEEKAKYLPLEGGDITNNLTVKDKYVVRSINGVVADENGNVVLTISDGNYLLLEGGNITGNLTVQNKNVVRSVNGAVADESGEITLDLGGKVKSVNNIKPDEQGNVNLSSVNSATKATQDGDGANIASTYVKLATAQTITAQHNFSTGVNVNGYLITVG